MVSRDWGEKGWGILLNGCRVSVFKMRGVLEMDTDEGSTTMGMYLIPLNCRLIMIKMVNFKFICVAPQ